MTSPTHPSDLPAKYGVIRIVRLNYYRISIEALCNDGTYLYKEGSLDNLPTTDFTSFVKNADLVSGCTESIDVQANSYTETTITHNMGVVPNIIVSLRALTGQIDRADALTALIQEVTSNTATVRVFNSGTVQSGVNLYWIALRK